MGNTWEVWTYGQFDDGTYGHTMVWSGESAIKCILTAIKAKRSAGYVKVDWR